MVVMVLESGGGQGAQGGGRHSVQPHKGHCAPAGVETPQVEPGGQDSPVAQGGIGHWGVVGVVVLVVLMHKHVGQRLVGVVYVTEDPGGQDVAQTGMGHSVGSGVKVEDGTQVQIGQRLRGVV
jgi:hypothetical protein